MTEGQRPAGGKNEPDAEGVPGTRPEPGQVDAPDPETFPRAAQGEMSEDVTRTPSRDADPAAPAKAPDVPDATGPQG
jgi:hypothetical protein